MFHSYRHYFINYFNRLLQIVAEVFSYCPSSMCQIDEEIKRLQGIVSSRVCDSVKAYDVLCRDRFNLLQDVSRWLFAQQDMLVSKI